ncbi:CvpA family protein [Enterococcus cecorum]|nr:CvpA family protein [Enterococcus cecorum]
MLNILFFFLLIFSFYSGGRRGLAYQLIYSIGFMLSFLVAKSMYQGLAKKLELYIPYMSVTEDSKLAFYSQSAALDLDKAYYAAVSFFLILAIGWLVTKFIGIFFMKLRFVSILDELDWLPAGLLNTGVYYTFICLFFYILSMIPLATIQNLFFKPDFASFVVKHSPILSNMFEQMFLK